MKEDKIKDMDKEQIKEIMKKEEEKIKELEKEMMMLNLDMEFVEIPEWQL